MIIAISLLCLLCFVSFVDTYKYREMERDRSLRNTASREIQTRSRDLNVTVIVGTCMWRHRYHCVFFIIKTIDSTLCCAIVHIHKQCLHLLLFWIDFYHSRARAASFSHVWANSRNVWAKWHFAGEPHLKPASVFSRFSIFPHTG